MARSENDGPMVVPPSSVYAQPEIFTVSTSDAMLYSVRWKGDRACVRNVHCAHALAAATIIVSFAPSRSSAAKSTAYDTDIVEPLLASGRLTFSADASDEHPRRTRNRTKLVIEWGAKKAKTSAPAARTAPTKSRAANGSSFTFLRLGEAERAEGSYRESRSSAYLFPASAASRLRRPAGRVSGSS